VVDDHAGAHTAHFYAGTFREALQIFEATAPQWEHVAIYLVSGGCRQESNQWVVSDAFELWPHGYVCRLASGLEVLVPNSDTNFGTADGQGMRTHVYAWQVPSSSNAAGDAR
jgi:hypothetical protein